MTTTRVVPLLGELRGNCAGAPRTCDATGQLSGDALTEAAFTAQALAVRVHLLEKANLGIPWTIWYTSMRRVLCIERRRFYEKQVLHG
jgi:hypothetical protein